MMKLVLRFFLAAFIPTVLWAAPPEFRVIPSHPDSHDSVRVVAYPSCLVGSPQVTRSDRQIRIELFPGASCITTWNPIPRTVELGPLEPGEWEIVVSDYEMGTSRATIDVRGVDPFAVYPAGLPSNGGVAQIVAEHFFPFGGRVFFGDVEADVVLESPRLLVEAPPHPPGIVDVTVITPDGKTFVVPHAFKYFEPSAEPDPFVFEPLLFPSSYQGPGAVGSEWRSENVVAPTTEVPLLLHEAPCSSCSTRIAEPVKVDAPSRHDGLLLYVARDASEAAASSRIRDISRAHETAGTELPVVEQQEFRDEVVLTNIPADPRHRTMLRVWALDLVPLWPNDDPERNASVFLSNGRSQFLHLIRFPEGLPFASIDLTPLIGPDDELLTLRITSDRAVGLWAMVTITNNETQQVTALTPR